MALLVSAMLACASGSQMAIGRYRVDLARSTRSDPSVFYPPSGISSLSGIFISWLWQSYKTEQVQWLKESVCITSAIILLAKSSHMVKHHLKGRGGHPLHSGRVLPRPVRKVVDTERAKRWGYHCAYYCSTGQSPPIIYILGSRHFALVLILSLKSYSLL